MTHLSELQRHIASMDELRDVVGAMRSLAGMRIQEGQHALPGVRRYAEAMADAIGAALLLLPRPDLTAPARGRRALLLFAPEHGFVGGLNEALIEKAAAAATPQPVLFVLGSRGAVRAREQGLSVAWTWPMATRVASAPQSVGDLTTELFRRIAAGEIARVEIIFARSRQGEATTIEQRQLFPLDLASLSKRRPRDAPLVNLAPQILLEKLMLEYVFALLTEAAIESVASENAARFAAMEAAFDNVTQKLEQLRQSARQERQSEITTELLELVTGAEAIERPPDRRRRR